MNFLEAVGQRFKDATVDWTYFWYKVLGRGILVILLMFGLNGLGIGGMTINLIISLAGFFIIFLAGTSLPAIGAAGVGGGIFEALQDRDASQGVVKGFTALGNLIYVVAIVWIIAAGALSTIPFGWNVWSFLVLIFAALVGAVVNQYFQLLEGKWLAWGMLSYAAVFAVIALLNLSDQGQRVLESGGEALVTTVDLVTGEDSVNGGTNNRQVNLTINEGVEINDVKPGDIFTISLPQPTDKPACTPVWTIPGTWKAAVGYGGSSFVTWVQNEPGNPIKVLDLSEEMDRFLEENGVLGTIIFTRRCP